MVIKDDKRVSTLMLTLVVVFVSCLMISNILANHMIQIYRWSFDGGTILFPVTYILSDVFSEVYGYKWSRRVTWMAASMNALFAILVFIATSIPSPEWYDATHFELALSSSARIVIASIVSYVCGDWVNDLIFRHMKRKNPHFTAFKIRAIFSSAGGAIVDTTLFVLIAFAFTMPFEEMPAMIILSVVTKIAYELIILPVTCKVTQIIDKQEKKCV